MQILKRYWFLPLGILIAVLSFLWGQAESKDSQNSWDLRPHFMIQDKIFWMSSQPCGRPHPEDFTYVASIAFTQTDNTKLVTQNYEANGLLEGTPIYMNPEIPYQAYTENWRFVVEEATFRCIRHDGGIYVDSGNLYTSGTYHEGYVSLVHKGSQKNDACNLTLFIHVDLLDNRPPKGSFLFLGQAVIETAEAFC